MVSFQTSKFLLPAWSFWQKNLTRSKQSFWKTYDKETKNVYASNKPLMCQTSFLIFTMRNKTLYRSICQSHIKFSEFSIKCLVLIRFCTLVSNNFIYSIFCRLVMSTATEHSLKKSSALGNAHLSYRSPWSAVPRLTTPGSSPPPCRADPLSGLGGQSRPRGTVSQETSCRHTGPLGASHL